MTILTEPAVKKQDGLVEAGLKNGLRHEVVKQEGRDEYLTACGERIGFENLILYKQPRKNINCAKCRIRNDADFRARQGRG